MQGNYYLKGYPYQPVPQLYQGYVVGYPPAAYAAPQPHQHRAYSPFRQDYSAHIQPPRGHYNRSPPPVIICRPTTPVRNPSPFKSRSPAPMMIQKVQNQQPLRESAMRKSRMGVSQYRVVVQVPHPEIVYQAAPVPIEFEGYERHPAQPMIVGPYHHVDQRGEPRFEEPPRMPLGELKQNKEEYDDCKDCEECKKEREQHLRHSQFKASQIQYHYQ